MRLRREYEQATGEEGDEREVSNLIRGGDRARCSENAASMAVTGLPEANFMPERILKVNVLPSSLTVTLSATPPTSVLMSVGSNRMMRS